MHFFILSVQMYQMLWWMPEIKRQVRFGPCPQDVFTILWGKQTTKRATKGFCTAWDPSLTHHPVSADAFSPTDFPLLCLVDTEYRRTHSKSSFLREPIQICCNPMQVRESILFRSCNNSKHWDLLVQDLSSHWMVTACLPYLLLCPQHLRQCRCFIIICQSI